MDEDLVNLEMTIINIPVFISPHLTSSHLTSKLSIYLSIYSILPTMLRNSTTRRIAHIKIATDLHTHSYTYTIQSNQLFPSHPIPSRLIRSSLYLHTLECKNKCNAMYHRCIKKLQKSERLCAIHTQRGEKG